MPNPACAGPSDAAMDGGGYVLRSTGQIFFTKPGMIEVMCDTARELGVYR